MGVIPWDYIPDPRYSSEYSCGTLLFISCGSHLRCKPCPDETTITAINMRRWERSVSSLKIIWRSVHNKLYTLKFPWNILFWSCKRWQKLCLCSSNWNTTIPAIFLFFSIINFSMSYFFSFIVVSYVIQPSRSSSRRHLIIRTKADPTKGLTINTDWLVLRLRGYHPVAPRP